MNHNATCWQKHKTKVYIVGGAIVGVIVGAGFTHLIMRTYAHQPIGHGTSVTATRGFSVNGKKVVMGDVSFISSDRKGPPSWVVKCKETGDVFRSQSAAAKALDLPESELSKHLNGLMDHVRGYTFERICIAG